MFKKNKPPEYALSGGPMMVADQWNKSSPIGPALQFAGGSACTSLSSEVILVSAIVAVVTVPCGSVGVCWCVGVCCCAWTTLRVELRLNYG